MRAENCFNISFNINFQLGNFKVLLVSFAFKQHDSKNASISLFSCARAKRGL